VNALIRSSIAVKGIIAIINFSLIIITANYLGAEGRGKISFFITVLATVQLFSEVMNGPTIIYLSTRLSMRKKILISSLWALLVATFAYLICVHYKYSDSFMLAFCSWQFSMGSTTLMILQGHHKIKWYNGLIVLQSCMLIGLFTALLAWTDTGYSSYPYAFLFSWNIIFIIAVLVILRTLQDRAQDDSYSNTFLQMFKKGIESQSGNIIAFLNYRLIFYIIAFRTDNAMLGFVSTGFAIIESILIIGNGLGTIQYPAISNHTDPGFPKKITLQYLSITLWLSLIGLLILNSIPASFYTLVLGKDFREIKQVFLILTPGILFLNLQNIICFYFNGLGLYRINTIGSFVGLLSFILLALPGYNGGILPLIASVSLSYLILCVYMFARFKKHSSSSWKELLSIFRPPVKILYAVLKGKELAE